MNINLPYQTLHCHTRMSDGLLTYEQVLEACESHKIGVVAFTDHDNLISPEKFKELKNSNSKVKFISGIEMTCDRIPPASEDGVPFEIIGLFLDPMNKELNDFLYGKKKNSLRRMHEYIDGLKKLGFEITFDEVMKISGNKTFGRPHLVTALKSHSKNFDILDRFVLELKAEAKSNEIRKKQFEEIENRVSDQKWFNLILSPGTIHEVFPRKKPEEKSSVDQVVGLIRGAGGVAIIPHYSYFRERLTMNIVEDLLKNKTLDGMETIFGYDDDYRQDTFKQDIASLIALCEKYSTVQGGGGDFHKPEDFDRLLLPERKYLTDRTIGLVERILQLRPDLKTTWTTL